LKKTALKPEKGVNLIIAY